MDLHRKRWYYGAEMQASDLVRRTAATTLLLAILAAAPGCTTDAGGARDDASVAANPDAGDAPALDAAISSTGCTPTTPRSAAPEILIGPTGLEAALLARINGAQSDLSLMMYQLTVTSFIDAFIAAKDRGVTVRVLLDGHQAANDTARQRLTAAGVLVKTAPSAFEHAHSKILVIDRALPTARALVMSANMNSFSVRSERNYGAVLSDPEDVADLAAVFEADWAAGDGAAATVPATDVACTRLLVSPANARERLLALVRGAARTLDLSVMYVSDADLRAAIKARAAAGVTVRVLLAEPGWITANTATATELGQAGIPVRFLETAQLHAKLVIADGVAFVGSQNLSWTSLDKNRELGVLVFETAAAQTIATQFGADWAAGTPAP